MKRMNVKKYTIAILVCFLSFFSIAQAKNVLTYGKTLYIGEGYKNLSCRIDGNGSGAFTLKQTSTGTYGVTYSKVAEEGTEDKIVCTYGSNNSVGIDDSGEFTVVVSVSNEKTETKVNVDQYTGTVDLLKILNASNIVSVESVQGKENIDLDCSSGSNCSMALSSNANEGTKTTASFDVLYNVAGSDQTFQTKVVSTPVYHKGARAYPGGVGVCDFDRSQWEFKTWDDTGGTHYSFYQSVGDGGSLPDCTPKDDLDLPVEFKGWIEATPGRFVRAVGECDGAHKANTSVGGGDVSYSACYEMKKTVQLAINRGTLNVSEWKKVDGLGYYYNGSNTTSITLPDLSYVGFNDSYEFEYWENKETKEQKKAGDTVELDGSVWVEVYKRTEELRSYDKKIYVDKTVVFSHSGSKEVYGCEGNGNLEANMVSGECQVKGLEVGTGEVILKTDLGEITFNVTIASSTGSSQNGDDEWVVDLGANVHFSTEPEYGEITDGIITSSCYKFEINIGGGMYLLGDPAIGRSHIYTVKNVDCDSSEEYIAMCLDPGWVGPGEKVGGKATNTKYVKSGCQGAFDGGGCNSTEGDLRGEMLQIVTYVVKNFDVKNFKTADNPERVAAHIALRLAAVNTGYTSTNATGLAYQTHHNTYVDWAKAWKTGSFDEFLKSFKLPYYTDKVSGYTRPKSTYESKDAQIVEKLREIYMGYVDEPYERDGRSVSGKFKNEIRDKSTEINKDGYDYIITYKGELQTNIELEADTIKFEGFSADGNVFGVVDTEQGFVLNEEATASVSTAANPMFVYNYTVYIKVKDALKVKEPLTAEEKKKYSFTLKFDTAEGLTDAFLAEPVTGEAEQRMVLFRVGGAPGDTSIYFDIIPNKNACELPELDPAKCTETSCPESEFNKVLFRAISCCEEITDEATYSYVIDNVCNGRCTTNTLAQICQYNSTLNPDGDKSEIYLIKEGSFYTGGEFSNQIGSCIVNVNTQYKKTNKTEFERTDDIGHSINVAHYVSESDGGSDVNQYCQVTCKEDWAISMDSFGNYVGERAVAAGTYFSVLNDIFIGGERTCYSSYLDYDKYMNDLTKYSEEIVKQYNIYSTNVHAWTNINNRTPADIDDNNDIIKNQKGCALWEQCPSGYSWDGSTCKKTVQAIYNGCSCSTCGTAPNTYTCCSWSWSCPNEVPSSPYQDGDDSIYSQPGSGSGSSCPSSTVAYCTFSVELRCKTPGQVYDYYLATDDNDVEDEKYDKYTWDDKTEVTTVFTEKFDTEAYIKDGSEGALNDSYERRDYIDCEITENKGPGNADKVTCKFRNDKKRGSEPANMPNDTATSHCQGGYAASSQLCKSNCPTSSYDWKCGSPGDYYDKTKAFNELQPKIKDITDKRANDANDVLTEQKRLLYNSVNDMYDCQHFQLYNSSDENNGKAKLTAKDGNALGNTRKFVQIETAFDPKTSYSYDEDSFMTILGSDNILVENEVKNNENISDYNNVTNQEVEVNIVGFDKYGNEYYQGNEDYTIKLMRDMNYMYYYDPENEIWDKEDDATAAAYRNYEDSSEVEVKGAAVLPDDNYEIKEIVLCTVGSDYKTYVNNGTMEKPPKEYTFVTNNDDKTWKGGACYPVKIRYAKAHYVKSYIGNSSYYKNKGSWFVRSSDVKEHGDSLSDALTKANNRSTSLNYPLTQDEFNRWSIIGSGYNIFPISLDTPRNLYQYTYEFKDVGSYSDGTKAGELGRIMGNSDSVILLNTRTCFYEVYEEICLCCGSTIKVHVDGESYVDDFLNSNPAVDYSVSSIAAIDKNEKGVLTVASSSISLGDVGSVYGTGRKVPKNWDANAPFAYNGVLYYTDKGADALNEIEAKGEAVYGEQAEYSYYLTPATMSAIRDYNSSYGYEINFDNLRTYGRVAIKSIDGGSDPSSFEESEDKMNDEIANFQHYGSIFLEDNMEEWNAVLDGTLTKYNDTICTVDAGGVSDIGNLVRSQSCRWVDYIEASRPMNPSDPRVVKESTYFRLAFK